LLLKDLIIHLNTELNANVIKDYCPNGLQVEGSAQVNKLITGVTASEALIDEAISCGANAVLVHHGYFWKGEAPQITGMKKRRLQKLLKHDISLLAYHLPIDVHPSLGNNAKLGKRLGLQDITSLDSVTPKGIIMQGTLPAAISNEAVKHLLADKLGRSAVSVGTKTSIKRIAWCTGGGQGYIDEIARYNDEQSLSGAAHQVIDAFLSGEISEQTTHSAIEQNIDFFAAGHHATERYGVKAVGEWLGENFDLSVEFIDIDNPA
jgi:dinuclear metal center YbgI/SA1388 family protein